MNRGEARMEVKSDPVGTGFDASEGVFDALVTPQIFTPTTDWDTRRVHTKRPAGSKKPIRAGLSLAAGGPAQETPKFCNSFSLNLFSPLTPTSLSTSLPSLKNTTVGIAEMRGSGCLLVFVGIHFADLDFALVVCPPASRLLTGASGKARTTEPRNRPPPGSGIREPPTSSYRR